MVRVDTRAHHDRPFHAPFRPSDIEGRGDEEDSPSKTGYASRRSWRRAAPSSTGRERYWRTRAPPSTSISSRKTSRTSARPSTASSQLLDIDRDEIIDKLKDARDFPSSFPVKIESDMSMDQVAKVEANKFYLPGVAIQIEPKRNYPYNTMLSHVLGYVSEISTDELKSPDYKNYAMGDTIGKFGLERMYEKYLRGVDGEQRVEVDASGKEVRVLDTKEPVSGNSLYLNIDMDVQATVEHALEGKKGGAVIADPRTGGVLALVSHPAFDPNQLTSGSREYWKSIATDPSHPLQNRVIQGRFPPGSTFKPLVALAALEKGVINEHTTFSCPGHFAFGGHVFKCWQKRGHGAVSIHKGIVQSCDVFFYNTGLKTGVDSIHEMASLIGITKPTGIDLPGEKSGLVPSTEWKKKTFGEKWYEGETVSVAIGQGAVWLTPIGLMQLASFVGNEGVTFKPQIVNRIVSPEGKVIKRFEPVMSANVKLNKQNITLVKDAMKGVVNEPGGTAYSNCPSREREHERKDGIGAIRHGRGRPRVVYRLCAQRHAIGRDGHTRGARAPRGFRGGAYREGGSADHVQGTQRNKIGGPRCTLTKDGSITSTGT